MIVGGPTMALATLRLPQRLTLVLALTVFAAGHVIAALTSSFTIVLAARFVAALATGAFWAVGFVIATTAAGPANATRAVSAVMGGLTLANVVGVPAGSLAGHVTGWRGLFWALAALAALAAAVIGRFLPRTQQRPQVSVGDEIRALRQGRLWLALAAAVLIMGGVLAVYTYITPLLTDRAGIPAGAVPLVLIAFGSGALGGTAIGGRFGDRRPMVTTIPAAAATALILLALIPLSTSPAGAVALIFLMALAGFTINPVVTALTVRFVSNAPTLASALTTSAYNTGIAARLRARRSGPRLLPRRDRPRPGGRRPRRADPAAADRPGRHNPARHDAHRRPLHSRQDRPRSTHDHGHGTGAELNWTTARPSPTWSTPMNPVVVAHQCGGGAVRCGAGPAHRCHRRAVRHRESAHRRIDEQGLARLVHGVGSFL